MTRNIHTIFYQINILQKKNFHLQLLKTLLKTSPDICKDILNKTEVQAPNTVEQIVK